MALADILNLVAAQLLTIPSAGIVNLFRPIGHHPQDLVTIFGSDQNIKAWFVSLDDRDSTLEERQTNIHVMRKYRILIEFYRSVIDPSVTEPETLGLSEQAMTKFRNMATNNVVPYNIEYSDAPNRVEFTRVDLGNTFLCHYVRHIWTVHERIIS